MKTITAYIIILLFSLSLAAQTTILEEGFESGTFPPQGWVTFRGIDDLGPNNDWTTTATANTGATAAFSRYSAYGVGIAEDWLVTEMIDLSSVSNSELRFFSTDSYGAFSSQYTIRVSTNSQTTHADFTTIATYNEIVGIIYEEFIIDLSAYDGQQIYIAFVHVDENQDNWYLDDISVSSSYFTVDNITYWQSSENTVDVFSACMETIDIPETVSFNGVDYTVENIGNGAFWLCSELVSVNIPNSINQIGSDAFIGCTSLESVVIPDSVNYIDSRAFYGCTALTSVTLPSTLTAINERTFYECTALTTIQIPETVQSIGDRAFYSCESLTSLTLPENISVIEDFTFYRCNSLSGINIPASVNAIGAYAFSQCADIYEVTVNWNTPIALNSLAFANTDISTIALYVPLNTVQLYEAENVWTDFNPILEIGECSNIDITAAPNVNLGRNNSTDFYAQTFTANCDANLDTFAFFARVIPEVEQVLPAGTFNIYEGNPETGTIIYSQDFDAIEPIGDGELLFDLNTNLPLIANETYSIEIPVTFLNISILYQNPYPFGNPYINGAENTSDWDFFFTVNMTEETLSIDNHNRTNLNIFPNPTRESIRISNLNSEENYTIYDVLGKKVDSGKFLPESQISVSHLEKGIYFLKLDNYKTLKFIKQ